MPLTSLVPPPNSHLLAILIKTLEFIKRFLQVVLIKSHLGIVSSFSTIVRNKNI